MIPLVNSLGGFLAGETALTIGGDRGEWTHLDRAHGKDIPMTGEPVSRLLMSAGIDFGIAQVEHLYFNAVG